MTALRIAGVHHRQLMTHLFPDDGLEAVAFAVCGPHTGPEGNILSVQRIEPVPYGLCHREATKVTWPTSVLEPLLAAAKRKHLALVKLHSHPTGYTEFSTADNTSDVETFTAIFSWLDNPRPHASAILLPDGTMIGRALTEAGPEGLTIMIVGDDIITTTIGGTQGAAVFERQDQLFGTATTRLLRGLRIAVVGCSGTGSIVIELLARLGVGKLVLIDDDRIEARNVNRIMNSRMTDLTERKVEVLAQRIRAIGLDTCVRTHAVNLYTREAVRAVAGADVVFGCMDTAEGRHLLNRIATFYVIPYIDLGVHLRADGNGNIDEASGVVHYVQPGGSSLLSRGAYTLERVRAENLYRTNPKEYAVQRRAGYIENVTEDSPAVISINATIASLAVSELLARLHPFRSCLNADAAITRMNFMETLIAREAEGAPCTIFNRHIGRADVEPLLDMPALSH